MHDNVVVFVVVLLFVSFCLVMPLFGVGVGVCGQRLRLFVVGLVLLRLQRWRPRESFSWPWFQSVSMVASLEMWAAVGKGRLAKKK